MQTNGEQTAIVPPVDKPTLQEAQQVFHTACAAAAVSSVEMHTVLLVQANGVVKEKCVFQHEAQHEPEVEAND